MRSKDNTPIPDHSVWEDTSLPDTNTSDLTFVSLDALDPNLKLDLELPQTKDPSIPSFEIANREQRIAAVREVLANLGPRDHEIALLRFAEDNPPSLRELAKVYGVSPQRIHQIEKRLKSDLRNNPSLNALFQS